MKFTVTFKTPDALDEAIIDASQDMADRNKMRATAKPFVEYGEYISVEFDTETKTAIVVPV